ATGDSTTSTSAFAANTSGSIITVLLGGTNVPLPNAQNIGAGITINAANEVFTITTAGRYYITYQINITTALLVRSRLIVNGAANLASTVTPILSLSTFNNDVILTLAANSTVSLQLFGLAALVTLLGNGAGAAVTIIRLS
ncbi:BclA C-terminal domain-containing protein, partial [Paenibacillus plantiphilus]|uniref:BclA C-terminal domain-containing protein n=1 Tax=Paenibacillus plantiphilus TaxID=2905650 RepID=UPI003FCEC368